MENTTTKKDSNLPLYENISEKPEYQKLVEWCATPTPLREPATQQQLAATLGVDENTVSRWKRMPEFYGDVRTTIKRNLRDEIPDVLYALRNRIFQKGESKEIKLFLEWVDEFVPTTKVVLDDDNTDDPSVRSLVQEFERQLYNRIFKKPEPIKLPDANTDQNATKALVVIDPRVATGTPDKKREG